MLHSVLHLVVLHLVVLHNLPSFVRDIYDAEKKDADGKFDFHWARTTELFSEHPNRLLARHFLDDDCEQYQTFLHFICEEGRADLLSLLLERPGDGIISADEKKKFFFASCLVRDCRGDIPLKLAMDNKSGGCVRVLFRCLKELFHTDNSLINDVKRQNEVSTISYIASPKFCSPCRNSFSLHCTSNRRYTATSQHRYSRILLTTFLSRRYAMPCTNSLTLAATSLRSPLPFFQPTGAL